MTLYRERLQHALQMLPEPPVMATLHGPGEMRPGRYSYQAGRWFGYPRRVKMLHNGIVHVTDQGYGELCAAAQVPSLCTVHDLIPLRMHRGELGGTISAPAWMLFKRAMSGLRKAVKIVAVSHSTADDLCAALPELAARIEIIPHGIEPIYADVRPEPPEQEWCVGHIGNNWGYKNVDAALTIAVELARRKLHPVRFLKVGDSLSAQQQVRLRDAGVALEAHTPVSTAQMAGLLARLHLLLVPSLWEGFGWPPLEAMSAGVPVLVSRRGALAEYAVPGAAVTLADPHILSCHTIDECVQLLTDEGSWRQAGESGRRWASRFSWRDTASRTLALYREVGYV